MSEEIDYTFCRNCVYFETYSDVILGCCYLLRTNKRRPCDPGEGCTVKIARKRKRVKKNGEAK